MTDQSNYRGITLHHNWRVTKSSLKRCSGGSSVYSAPRSPSQCRLPGASSAQASPLIRRTGMNPWDLVQVELQPSTVLCTALYCLAGWIRPPIIFSAKSVYDGCITIILSNGTIVAQGGVVFEYCQGLQVSSRLSPLTTMKLAGYRGGVRVLCVWYGGTSALL